MEITPEHLFFIIIPNKCSHVKGLLRQLDIHLTLLGQIIKLWVKNRGLHIAAVMEINLKLTDTDGLVSKITLMRQVNTKH